MSVAIARPLVLPKLSREEVARRNRLCWPRASLELGDGWMLHDRPAPPLASWLGLALRVGDSLATLLMPAGLALALARDVAGAPASPDAALLPPLVALRLSPLLDRLQAATGLDTVVLGSAPVSLPADARRLTLQALGATWPLALAAADNVLADLLRFWPPASLPVDAVSFPATLRLGATGLGLGALRALMPGEVVLFEHGQRARRGGPERGQVLLAGRRIAAAHRSLGGWRLEEAPRDGDPREALMGGVMVEGRVDDGADGETDEDDLPVMLCFDLGHLELTLAALRALGPGSVLALPAPSDAPVRVTVGGRTVGTGELVEIEGQLGVQLMRIFGRG